MLGAVSPWKWRNNIPVRALPVAANRPILPLSFRASVCVLSRQPRACRVCLASRRCTTSAWHPAHLKALCLAQNELTPWSWALLERSLVVWALGSFPAFYGAQRFDTEFTRTLHLSLSWARPIQSTSPHPASTRCILILCNHTCLGLPNGLFPFDFPTNKPIRVPFLPHSCYKPRSSHPPRLNYYNNTWQRVQIMKLLIMKFSLFSCHLMSLWSEYPLQHLVLKHS
jgi:hypothetical protein